MEAVQFVEYGGPEVLRVVEVEEPYADTRKVRIAVRAAGVNGIDWKIRAGSMREHMPLVLPSGTRTDAASVIDEVGDGVDDVAVFGQDFANIAGYAVLSAWATKPAGLSFEEAAGYPIPVETAIRILNQVGVQSDETLLVNGASGGVGSAVLQIARARGITVIGVADVRHQAYLRSLGAVLTTYGVGLVERVRALAPSGVDAAFDLAGSGVIPELGELVDEPAKVVSIPDFTAPNYGAQVSLEPANPAIAFVEEARLFTEGALRIPVEKAFPLAAAGDAQAASAAGHVADKFVVTVP